MVRFGAHFRDVVDPAFAQHGVPYKRLKKHIKKQIETSESMTEEGVAVKVQETSESMIEEGVAVIGRADSSLRWRGLQNAEQDLEQQFVRQLETSIAELNQLMERELSQNLDAQGIEQLRAFADLNQTAILKICKKYVKKVGPCDDLQQTLERLPQEPFVSLLAAGQSQAPQGPQDEAGSRVADAASRSAHLRLTRAQNLLLCMSILGLLVFFSSYLRLQSEHLSGALRGLGLLIIAIAAIVYGVQCLMAGEPRPVSSPRRLWERVAYFEGFDVLQHGKVRCKCMIVHSDSYQTTQDGCHRAEPAPSHSGDIREFDVEQGVDSSECCCCLEAYKASDAVAILPCAHVFHESCIVDWAATATRASAKCPQCRTRFDW